MGESISKLLQQDFYVPPSSIRSSRDFKIHIGKSVKPGQEIDYLIYFSSKGSRVSRGDSQPVHERICSFLENRHPNSIVVSRPTTNTTLISLIYLLRKLNVSVSNLITDVGFLDFTPKNSANLLDYEVQMNEVYPGFLLPHINLIEDYYSIYGESVALFRNEVEVTGDLFSKEISRFIKRGVFLVMGFIPNEILLHLKKPLSINPCYEHYRVYMNKFFNKDELSLIDLQLSDLDFKKYFIDDAHLSSSGHEWIEGLIIKEL